MRYYYSSRSGQKGKETGRGNEPNIYFASQKPACSHASDGITLAQTKKWGIMMTKPCPQMEECERNVKRSTRSRLHAFLCSDLTEMQRQAGCPPVSREEKKTGLKKIKKKGGKELSRGNIKESLFLDSRTAFRRWKKLKPQPGLIWVSVLMHAHKTWRP